MKAQWQNPRKMSERLIIRADLELISPTHIGCGDEDSLLDMPLARDPLTDKALLAGASVAGALRAYLVKCGEEERADLLFGQISQKVGYESPLIVDDAIGEIPGIEIRDGVAIDPASRTAADKKKYDFELMPAGMKFEVSFELLVTQGKECLVEALALALKGLETGEIGLGKRKRRGFGECKVRHWQVWRFPWNASGMLSWLTFDNQPARAHRKGDLIDQLLLDKPVNAPSKDKRCVLTATFLLQSSILIRSEVDLPVGQSYQPYKRHLRRKNNGKEELIISGTSLAGALRARARRICNTLGKDGGQITAGLFGNSPEAPRGGKAPRATASRVWVKEIVLSHPQKPLEMVQSRVSIDRFTGGALESRLFSEQPVFGDPETRITMRIEIEKAQKSEVGLLLLLLKDLWISDLPLGGESSIGRGLLTGQKAELHFDYLTWNLDAVEDAIHISGAPAARLQDYVNAFNQEGPNEHVL